MNYEEDDLSQSLMDVDIKEEEKRLKEEVNDLGVGGADYVKIPTGEEFLKNDPPLGYVPFHPDPPLGWNRIIQQTIDACFPRCIQNVYEDSISPQQGGCLQRCADRYYETFTRLMMQLPQDPNALEELWDAVRWGETDYSETFELYEQAENDAEFFTTIGDPFHGENYTPKSELQKIPRGPPPKIKVPEFSKYHDLTQMPKD